MKLFSRIFSMLVIAFTFSVLFCTPTFAEESLSISVDGVVEVEATPNTLETGTVDVYVSSSSRDGYKLSISDSDNENALVSGQGNAINPLAESVTADNFTTNAWGVKVGDNFLPVPKLTDNVLELVSTNKSAENEKNTVTFGMKVDGTAASGAYSSEVVFTAVANPLVVRQTTLQPGPTVNTTWKTLANNSSTIFTADDNKITSIQKFAGDFTDALRSAAQDIATADSDWPVYTWFDDGTIYYYTEADEVFFNADSRYMFYKMQKLVSADFNFGLETDVDPDGDGVQDPVYITSSVTNMSSMFSMTPSLTALDVSKLDTSNVTRMESMFYSVSALTNLDVSKWDTSNVTTMNSMFSGAKSLTALDVSKWDTGNVTHMGGMFQHTDSLATLDVSKWDTSNVTHMGYMFQYTTSLDSVDVSKWDTSNVTSMDSMFWGASALTTLDVSKWDTGNVTNMRYMFYFTSALTTLDVSKWNTSNVTNMDNMFSFTSALTTLDVSKWNTSKVTNMMNMFWWASALTNLDVSKWDTGNVTNMGGMFLGTTSLTTLDLSNWDTSKVTNMDGMFYGAKALTTIYASDKFNTNIVSESGNMFFNTTSLVGGNGTTYDSNHLDKEYARIDAPGTPGYFTEKQRAVRKATLKTGQEVNAAWKTLAKGSSANSTDRDEIIKSIKPSSNFPAGFQAVAVNIATDDSDYPVYAWFEGDTTISLYTDADEVFLNADSSDMFSNLTRLSIIGISFGVATDVDPDGDDIIVGGKDPVYIT